MQHKEIYELLAILTDCERNNLVLIIKSNRAKMLNDLVVFLLSQNELPTKEQVLKALYKKEKPNSESAYQRIITRAVSDILELLNYFIKKETKEFYEIDIAKIEIHQKSALLQFLVAKKSKITLIGTLRDEIIASATEFEFYPILIEQLYLKKFHSSLLEGETAYFEFEKEIAHFESCLYSIRKANELFNILKMKSLKTSVHDKKTFGKLLRKHLNILISEYKISKSPTVQYFLFQHQLSLCYLDKKYVGAKRKCLQLKKIVEENKSINRIDRAGIIYDNLAKCDAYLLNYSQAIIWSKNAQLCFKAGSRNYWVSLDQELLINIYQRNIPKAEQILVEIYKYQKNDKSVLERDTLLFYNAILCLEKGHYSKALSFLEERNEITKDAIGWDFWTRIITIYLNVLLGKDDVALKGVVSIKKQMQRISKNTDFRERDMIVFEIFLQLSKKGFSTFQPIAKIELLLTKLKETKNQWKPFTAEVIPFEKLFSMKYKKYAIL